MAATTTQLGLLTPTQGTLSGTWGDTVNNGITEYANIAIAGTTTFNGDGAVTLENTLGSASASNIASTSAQYMIVRVTGTLTTTKVITFGSAGSAPYSKLYLVDNAATGGAVTFKAYGQAGVSVAVGEKTLVFFNGTDIVKVATSTSGTGSVTTVGFTGGIVSVANPTTTPAFTIAGTSGGVPYFSNGTTWASSGALTQYGVVYGGGAGAAPVATANGTTGQAFIATTSGAPSWGTLGPAGGGTGVANNAAMTVTGSGNYGYTRTLTGTTNVTFPVTGTLATLAGTETLTNKRVTPRVLSATSYTTDTGTSLNADTLDEFIVTAQAGALKFNNPSGTPTDGQCLLIAVTGTSAQALTYDTQFQASTVSLPTTTVSTNRLNMGFIWSSATSKWIIVGAV